MIFFMVGFPFFFLFQLFIGRRTEIKAKNPVPAINLLGREKTSRGATRLDVKTHPLFAYQHTLAFINGDTGPGAHTQVFKPFPFALRSPFGICAFRCPHTVGSSLKEAFQSLLTLLHRFGRILAR
jgi:hypothetical protein